MKNDLISREALKEVFEKVYPLSTNEMGGVVNKRIYDIIDNAPTVDTYTIEDIKEVQEKYLILGAKLAQRPVGEWIAIEPYNHKTFCPFCKKDTRDINYDNFCPNCGADMRKGGAE